MKSKIVVFACQFIVFGSCLGTAAVIAFPQQSRTFFASAKAMVQDDGIGPELQPVPVPNEAFNIGDVPSARENNELLGEEGDEDGVRKLSKDDYQESWREAGNGKERLGTRIRTHVVRLQKDGSLRGKISLINPSDGKLIPISKVNVKFIRNGVALKQFTPEADGSFRVEGLEAGTYGMMADGPDGFIAWSVFINPAFEDLRVKRVGGIDGKIPVAFQEEETELAVNAAAVPQENLGQVNQLIRRYARRRQDIRYLEPEKEDIPESASEEGNDVFTEPEVRENKIAERDPTDVERGATSLRHHEVHLRPDGTLRGRVRRLHNESGRPLSVRRLNVFFVRNDMISAQVPVDDRGTFEAAGLQPGVYSVVAAGNDGFLAFSARVMPAKAPAVVFGPREGQHFVAFQAEAAQWQAGQNYVVGSRVEYEGDVYEVMQDHISALGTNDPSTDQDGLWKTATIESAEEEQLRGRRGLREIDPNDTRKRRPFVDQGDEMGDFWRFDSALMSYENVGLQDLPRLAPNLTNAVANNAMVQGVQGPGQFGAFQGGAGGFGNALAPGGFAPGGFAPGGGLAGSFAPPGVQPGLRGAGGGGLGSIGGGGGIGSILGLAGAVGGVVGLTDALDDDEPQVFVDDEDMQMQMIPASPSLP